MDEQHYTEVASTEGTIKIARRSLEFRVGHAAIEIAMLANELKSTAEVVSQRVVMELQKVAIDLLASTVEAMVSKREGDDELDRSQADVSGGSSTS